MKEFIFKGAELMSGTRLNILIGLLLITLFFLQYHLWFESGGISDMLKLKQTLLKQMKMNEELKQRNDELLFQIQRLQKSEEAVESRARNELGMIKKNETYYQIVK